MMKKIVLILTSCVLTLTINAQTQIYNKGFEEWESVPGGSEPVGWNSFMTAGGAMAQHRQNQIEESSDVRPGSSGSKSVRIWSKSIMGVKANGIVTLGKVNMGATLATDPSNYNITLRNEEGFNHPLTDYPDSIVFWAKFTPNGHNEKARMIGTIHDNYDYRDPEDANASDHVVAVALLNYSSTNGQWVRFSVPFDYVGPAWEARYILLTFATNMTPGGGGANDQVWIDDVELIYNEASVKNEKNLEQVSIYPNPVNNVLKLANINNSVNYTITSVLGQVFSTGRATQTSNSIDVSHLTKGVYFIQIKQGENSKTIRFIKN